MINPKVLNKKTTNEVGVYIGRPTVWGNPFVIGKDGNREDVVRKYEDWIERRPAFKEYVKRHLKGKNLICWCSPEACHGDVLLKIAND